MRSLTDLVLDEWTAVPAMATEVDIRRGWDLWVEARAAWGEERGITPSKFVEECELRRTLMAYGFPYWAMAV